MKKELQFSSICARETPNPKTTNPHVLPLYASSSFSLDSIDQGIAVFSGKEQAHVYSRYGNPTVEAVANKLARLEGHGLELEPGALLFSSGMSAISTVFLAALKSGDTLLTQGNLYGGTTELLLKVLQPLGIKTRFCNLQNLDEVEHILQTEHNIRMLYFETPANPTLACVDIQALAALAQKYNALSAIDNTFATPYLQQPLALGCDLVIHSTTKFLNGHGNSIAGAVIGRDAVWMKEKLWPVMKLAGTNVSPWDAWLLHNGLKTLHLRMERHCSNAQTLAEYLEQHPQVSRVNYNGLPSHPDHQLAKRQMRAYGGMLSFELAGGMEAGIEFMRSVKLCTLAPTLGDTDTLVLHPASSSHVNVDRQMRLENHITDGLVRVSVGIEAIEDLIADFEQAIATASKK